MAQAEQKIVQYLNEAHASELGLVRDLQAQIAMTPRGHYRNQNRTTILSKISSLRVEEPWPGYDELSVAAIRTVLAEGNETQSSEVHVYERSHKNRAGIMRAPVLESPSSVGSTTL